MKIEIDKSYRFETKLPLIRNKSVDCLVNVIIYDNHKYFLIYVDGSRYMKICLNKFNNELQYFETYVNYVDFKNLEEIIYRIQSYLTKNKIEPINLEQNIISEYDLECPQLIIEKENLSYCFSDDKFNYIDGVKQVKFYSEYKNPEINYPNSELILILMKYGNKYEYCIMDYNLDKVAKYVLEKNRLSGQYRLIRNEFYQDWSKKFSFSQFNSDFKKLANNNNKEEHIIDPDEPLKHGTCGFHFYHFFTIGSYFEDIKAS